MKIKRIAIDANLLLVLVIGGAAPELLESRSLKHLKGFGLEDFELLIDLVAGTDKTITTPNALTEVANLIGHIAEPLRSRVRDVLKIWIDRTNEQYPSSQLASADVAFRWLGLTDCAWLTMLARCKDVVLLTADHNLYIEAQSRGLEAINFNHVRERRDHV